MPYRAFALLGHRFGPTMSSAFRCSWLASARARHTHPLCSLSRLAAPHIRQRSVWKQQRHCTATAGADNGNSASADEQTFFATTPLYYVRTALDTGSSLPTNLPAIGSYLGSCMFLACTGQCRASHGERLHHDGSRCHCQVPEVAREEGHPCYRSALLNTPVSLCGHSYCHTSVETCLHFRGAARCLGRQLLAQDTAIGC